MTSSTPGAPATCRRRARLLLPRRLLFQDAPRRAGRAGARRLGHHRGRKARVLGLAPGSASRRRLGRLLADLNARGLGDPLLVISDGGPGLIGAAEIVFYRSLRQRCLIHRARNILAKVPVQPRPR